MARLGLDTSNYTRAPTAAWQSWPPLGVAFLLPQAIDPPAGYPPGCAVDQVQWGLDNGLVVCPYVWLWFGVGADDIRRRVGLLERFVGVVAHLWLDVEDTTPGPLRVPTSAQSPGPDAPLPIPREHFERLGRQPPPDRTSRDRVRMVEAADARLQDVAAALAVCDAFPTSSGLPTGIYSAPWFWGPYMGGSTAFADRLGWTAQYDGVPDPTVWAPFGGIGRLGLKQYAGTSTLGGVGNVDLNVAADDYLAELEPPDNGGGGATPDVDWGWQDKKPIVVGAAGELRTVADQVAGIGAEMVAEAARTSAPRKTVIRQLAARVAGLADGVRGRAEQILN